jgi:hypothetical protein
MNKDTKKDDMLRTTLLMLTILFPYPLFGMESNENNQQPDGQIAKLAYQASRNLNLGHGLIYLGSKAQGAEAQKARISYAYKKFERANNCVDLIKERAQSPERKKE